MGIFGLTKGKSSSQEGASTNKSFISEAESIAYANGGSRPITRAYQAYLEASSRLDTIIRTSASIASSARFQYGKLDSKGNFKETTFKQSDGLYMNDYQSESDWLFELFGTMLTYDKVLLVPEESKYKYRKGLIDWVIVPDDKFQANLGKTQTIQSFTYKSSSGVEQTFNYEDCIYITRNLTANNLIYAIPRLKSLLKTIENITGIHNFVGEYIQSGGKNSVIASSDALLSEEENRKVKGALRKFLRSNQPEALLLNSEKFSLSKVSDSLSTSGVLDIMTEISNEITKAFNMPSYLLGEYSSSTQSETVVNAGRTWFEIQMRPLFNTIGLAFSRHFRNAFGIKNALVKFDFSQIALLEDSDKEKQELAEKNLKMGIYSLNEARVLQGLEPLDDDSADLHLAPSYLLGSYPISFENWTDDISRNLNDEVPVDEEPPTGEGGEQNAEGLGGRE